MDAIVVLPDHLHTIWTLPPGDADFSLRWKMIKASFAQRHPAISRSHSKLRRGETGLWQRRFWEHCIRDDADLAAHVQYCWHNPVKHGWASQPQEWPFTALNQRLRPDILAVQTMAAHQSLFFGE